jgi:hypothetical protein
VFRTREMSYWLNDEHETACKGDWRIRLEDRRERPVLDCFLRHGLYLGFGWYGLRRTGAKRMRLKKTAYKLRWAAYRRVDYIEV